MVQHGPDKLIRPSERPSCTSDGQVCWPGPLQGPGREEADLAQSDANQTA
jgi:hypothetical protein